MGADDKTIDGAAAETGIGPGEIIAGHYVLGAKLGEGGMGAVFLAQHDVTKRKVAIKFLNTLHPQILARFRREATLANRIDHDAFVKTIEDGTHRGHPYLIMDFVEGRTLTADVRQFGMMAVSRAARILGEIASALQAAHDAGIIHRDLKPDNVILTRRDLPQVLDLGIAKDMGATDGVHTRTQAQMGTPGCMSPEQIRDSKNLDARSDIYALACIAYFMFGGHFPFEFADDGNGALTMSAHLNTPPPHLTDFAPWVPVELSNFLYRCLAKDPSARPQSMSEFAAEMAKWLNVDIVPPNYTPAPLPLSTSSTGGGVVREAMPSMRAGANSRPTRSGNGELQPNPPAKRSVVPAIVAGAVITTLVGGALVWKFALHHGDAPPQAKSGPGTLVLSTNPAGARVFVDGDNFGKSPVEINGNAGDKKTVRVELAGYGTSERRIEITAGKTTDTLVLVAEAKAETVPSAAIASPPAATLEAKSAPKGSKAHHHAPPGTTKRSGDASKKILPTFGEE